MPSKVTLAHEQSAIRFYGLSGDEGVFNQKLYRPLLERSTTRCPENYYHFIPCLSGRPEIQRHDGQCKGDDSEAGQKREA